MSEKEKAARLNWLLDSITESLPEQPGTNEEFTGELKLAQFLKKLDLSNESKIKDSLRRKLLSRLTGDDPENSSDKLDDEDLKMAAGGTGSEVVAFICPNCGLKFNIDVSCHGKCPHCGSKVP